MLTIDKYKVFFPLAFAEDSSFYLDWTQSGLKVYSVSKECHGDLFALKILIDIVQIIWAVGSFLGF